MTQELLSSNNQDGALAQPIDVIPAVMREYADGLMTHAQGLTINSAEDFKAAAEVLNNLTKTHSSLNKRRLDFAREYDAARDRNINIPAKPILTALEQSKKTIGDLMEAWDRVEREERARIEKEKEQQRLKAEQLLLEAQTRQDLAADKVAAAKDDDQFQQAAHEFDKGVAVDAEALELQLAALAVPTPALTEAKGVKDKMVVDTLTVTDLAALPITYHTANEKKIKDHILDGTLDASTPGIKFTLKKKFSGTGR